MKVIETQQGLIYTGHTETTKDEIPIEPDMRKTYRRAITALVILVIIYYGRVVA
jgi:hypothetical protein